jgi:type I restriction enzyme R subunit
MFNETNTVEQMVLDTLSGNLSQGLLAEELPRQYSSLLLEPMVRDELISLNPDKYLFFSGELS